MVAMLPLKALHDAFGLTRDGGHELPGRRRRRAEGHRRAAAQVAGRSPRSASSCATDGAARCAQVEPNVHAKPLAFNVVPLLGTQAEEGYTDEELKLQNESRKILEIPDLAVSPTCVRVPVMVGHCIAVRATFERPSLRACRARRHAGLPGLVLQEVPTPLEWAGRDEVAVGRVRPDLADPEHSLNFFVVGDNLLKGAALNTVQIAELLHERGLVGSRAAV